MPDSDLELHIEAAYQAFVCSSDKEIQKDAHALFTKLIAQRSPKQIYKMEVEQGLRK